MKKSKNGEFFFKKITDKDWENTYQQKAIDYDNKEIVPDDDFFKIVNNLNPKETQKELQNNEVDSKTKTTK